MRHNIYYIKWRYRMAKIKKAKLPKQPKPAFKEKVSREDKKLAKANKKRKKAMNKKIDRTLGIVAVILALISGVLDMINNKKQK